MSEYAITAFYGGTFDPIHYGHIKPIIVLSRLVYLKQVILLLNNIPYYRLQPIASALHRLAMVRLALAELSNTLFTIDDRELKCSTFSYTIDTFEKLRQEYGPNAPLAFIIGQDSFLKLPQWHRGLELPELCHILVCARPGYGNLLDKEENNNTWITDRLTCDPKMLLKKPAGLIYYASTPKLLISSSEIRARYHKGSTCDGLLPYSVQDYINKQKLYR